MKQNITRKLKRLIGAALAVALLGGCTLTERLTQQTTLGDNAPGTIAGSEIVPERFGMAYYEGETVNPVLSVSKINRLLTEALYEGLFVLDNEFQPQPVLCETYAGDGVNYTFTLKSGITFWSGTPVRAADVVATYEAARKSEASPYKLRLQQISSIKAVDERTVQIVLTEPNTSFPALLDIPIFRAGTQDDAFAEGCGPYQPQSDGAVRWLSAYKGWHGGKAALYETIQLENVTTMDAVEYSFETGDVSIARADRISAAPATYKGAIEIQKTPTTNLHFLGVNAGHAPLQLPQVRQAISLAIGRERICTTQLQGFANAAVLPVNPQPAAGETLSFSTTENGEEALLLLAQANVMDTDGDGVLDYADATGKRLPFTPVILVNEENTFKTAVTEQIIADLEQIGIRATMHAVSFEQFPIELANSTYDLFYGETSMTADFDLRPLIGLGGALNFGASGSTQTDALIAQARAATGDAKETTKKALYNHLLTTMPIVPIAFARSQIIVRDSMISNLQTAPYNVFYNVTEWTS